MPYSFARFISTLGYAGYLPFAPGTIGSLIALPLCYLLLQYAPIIKVESLSDHNLIGALCLSFLVYLTVFLILGLLGWLSTREYLKHHADSDPSEVIIDELVGQGLTIILILPTVFIVFLSKAASLAPNNIIFWGGWIFGLPFLLFRLFDIYKPWPINWCDKNIKGAFGVMFDDIVAAFFAAIMQYIIAFLLIDWWPMAGPNIL